MSERRQVWLEGSGSVSAWWCSLLSLSCQIPESTHLKKERLIGLCFQTIGTETRPSVTAEGVTAWWRKAAHIRASRKQAQGKFGGKTRP